MTTTIDPLPPPPDPSDSISAFNSKAFAFWAAMPAMRAQINVVNGEAYASAVAASASAALATSKAADAAASQISAASSASDAANSVTALAWVSGTAYAAGAVVWSPADGRIYRRRPGMGGAGTTDPSADATNWRLAAGAWWGSPVKLTVANNGLTLAVNTTYHLDSSGGAFSLVMPVMSANDWIKVVDIAGQLPANNVTITRNATNGNLAGFAEDRTLVMAFDSLELVKTASNGVIEQ